MGAKKYVAGAVVFGLLAGVFMLGFLQQLWSTQTTQYPALIAVREISPGQRFSLSDFEEIEVSANVAAAGTIRPEDVLSDAAMFAEQAVAGGLRQGELLTFSALAPAASGSVAPGIPDGKRALALQTAAFLTPIPPVLPGDVVDVYSSDEMGGVINVAENIVVNDVIRSGGDFMASAYGDQAPPAAGPIAIVVLEVVPDEARAIAGFSQGTLVLVVQPESRG